jgi:uncharacterized UPF0160 family protein
MSAVATHSGPFHADDVMAVALVRRFVAPDAQLVRTRDLDRIAACDIAVDVGGVYDPASGRFDHHQVTYTGKLSSAGMVVRHLVDSGRISASLADYLQSVATDYIDDVDNGRVAPKAGIPCFPRIVEALNALASTEEEFDGAFERALGIATALIDGLYAEHTRIEAAGARVREAMARAEAKGSNVLELDSYVNWKPAYFANGGETHPTEFALFPGTDGSWRVVAIPPKDGCFEQKRSLPAPWAGLTDAALEAVTGVPGSMFCHKNRFIAVFRTRENAVEALRRGGVLR